MSLTHWKKTAPATKRIEPPPWVRTCVGGPGELRSLSSAMSLQVSNGEDAALITATLSDAGELGDDEFRAQATAAYGAIFGALADTIPDRISGTLAGAPASRFPLRPVRFWNFLPDLRGGHTCNTSSDTSSDTGDCRDRYPIFNAGRFIAFQNEYGGRSSIARAVPTASAVGHDGDELIIHCLAHRMPGKQIDNPTQIRPYEYSARYGALPPCFARATLLRPSTLLVGGTASIVGEDSLHPHDLAGQTRQTLANLSTVVLQSGITSRNPLDSYTTLRVYYPNAADAERLDALLAGAFRNVGEIEWVRADLCRPELLVEIEGVCGTFPS